MCSTLYKKGGPALKSVIELFRELREDHDYSQRDIAAVLGISQQHYSKYETGENDIPTPILIALAKIHNTSIDYLLGLTDVQEPYPRAKK